MKTEIRLHELAEEGEMIPFKAAAIKQHHAYVDHGYRLELEGKVLSYTGDCGVSEKLIELVRDADLLIAEAGNKETKDPNLWGHLSPTQSATVAKEQNVKHLILTHFGADVFNSIEERKLAQEEARKIFPNTVAANDLFEFDL